VDESWRALKGACEQVVPGGGASGVLLLERVACLEVGDAGSTEAAVAGAGEGDADSTCYIAHNG
jgi:hypothetical protein